MMAKYPPSTPTALTASSGSTRYTSASTAVNAPTAIQSRAAGVRPRARSPANSSTMPVTAAQTLTR